MSSRNQKATLLTGGMFVLSIVLAIFAGLTRPETRIIGTIDGHKTDIPIYFQDEPDYKGKIKDAKVEQGFGWVRLLLGGLALVPCITGVVLVGERRAELEDERREYEQQQKEKQLLGEVNTQHKVNLKATLLKKTGEAQIVIHEEKMELQVDAYRELNGIYAPEPVKQIEPPVLRENPAMVNPFEGMKTPEQYAAEIEASRQAAINKLPTGGDAVEEPKVEDDRVKVYRDRGEKIMRSMASLRMSILSAAPTGAGKTHTLYRWLDAVNKLCESNGIKPDNYVISHKRDSFLGLLEQGRVAIFDDLNPEKSMAYLDKVYRIMKERLDTAEGDRKKFEKMPVRLILDDWFASYGVLRLDPALWNIVRTKIGAIITKGREANVCLYIATQSFNLEALGIQDSNIRGNLAITCQGLVTEKIDENGDLVEQGNYESLQLLINNNFIVSSKADRERLNAELEELIALSREHQVPAVFSAIGKPMVGLVPYYEKPIAGGESASTNVAVIDRKPEDDRGDNDDELPEYNDHDVENFRAKLQALQSPESPENPGKNGCDGVDSCNSPSNAGSNADSNAGSNADSNAGEDALDWELKDWYKWLPSKDEVIKIMEGLDARYYNFAYLIKSKLKKTEALYARKAKGAIVQLLLDLERIDLIEKFEIDPKQFPFID